MNLRYSPDKIIEIEKFRVVAVFLEKIWANFMKISEYHDEIWKKWTSKQFLKMPKKSTKFCWNIVVWAVQKHVSLVDLVKSFPTNIYLQKLASRQPRTSLPKFVY